MKALLRNYNGEIYVWKEVTYSEEGFAVDGRLIFNTEIVALENDNRNEFITCSVCGKTFRRDSEEWVEHIRPTTDTSKCFTCQHLRPEGRTKEKIDYKLNEDGTYHATIQRDVTLKCLRAYQNWKYADIETDIARRKCIYNMCSNATAKEVTDIFTEHPDVFEEMITVDTIVEAGYKDRKQCGNLVSYVLKGKNQIFTQVNELNIVDHFFVRFRNHEWEVYYSSKYNKFYSKEYTYHQGKYRYSYAEWKPMIPYTTEEYIKKKIAALYK